MCHGKSVAIAWLVGSLFVLVGGGAQSQTIQPRIIIEPVEVEPAAFQVERPTLGIRVSAVTEAARREHGLTTRRGALIVSVDEDGPCDRAGIEAGAAIVAVDGRRVDSAQDLIEFVRSARIGQDIELTYYDADQLRRKRVRLAGPDGDDTPRPDARTGTRSADDVAPRLPPPPPRPDAELLPDRTAERAPAERGQPPLRRLERALEGLTRPAGDLDDGPARGDDLRAEVDRLRLEVIELRRSIVELQERLALLEPRKAKPDVDDRPGLNEARKPDGD